MSQEIQELMYERRNYKNKERRKNLSKRIRKLTRSAIRSWRDAKFNEILDEYSQLNRLSQVGVSKSCQEDDSRPSESQFVDFLKPIYKSRRMHRPISRSNVSSIRKFTMIEVENAIDKLKTWKSADNAGIVAEMIKLGGFQLRESVLHLCNQILRNTEFFDEWLHTVFSMIPKKGYQMAK